MGTEMGAEVDPRLDSRFPAVRRRPVSAPGIWNVRRPGCRLEISRLAGHHGPPLTVGPTPTREDDMAY